MLSQAQETIAKDRHRFRVIRCGRRFGKTTLAVKEIRAKAISKKCRIAYFATTHQQARDIAWELLKKELQGAITSINESRLEIRVMTQTRGESLVQLRGWESVETARGQQYDLLVIDEVASMRNFWVSWEEVLRPTLTDTKGEVIFASTPKGYNHFYDLCNKELTDKEYKTFHFSSYDNPTLPVDELDGVKATLPPERFAQEYMASFQKTQGLVYKEFDRQKHLYDTLPEGVYQKIGGLDFGYKNPAALVDIRLSNEKFWIEDEWYKRERTEMQIAEYVSACKFDEVYPDPESPSAIEELRRKNVNVREVLKGKDSVQSGIQKIRELLLADKLMINKRCVNLISEFEMYAYDEKQAERNEKEKPLDVNNHALDSLRYVVLMVDAKYAPQDIDRRIMENRLQRQQSDAGI